MSAAVRRPVFDEQDFIGPEGRELLATLAEVEDDGSAARLPSLAPFRGPAEAWSLRTKPKSGQHSARKTSKYTPVSSDLIERKGFPESAGHKSKGGEKGLKKHSTGLTGAYSKKKYPDDVPFRGESSDAGFADGLPTARTTQAPLRPSMKKGTDSAPTSKKGVVFPVLQIENQESYERDLPELSKVEDETQGFYDEISSTEDEAFPPFFSPLNENLDAKLRQWSKAQRFQDIQDFALPSITPRELTQLRRVEARRVQSARSALDAIPELPKTRARSSVIQPQTARQYVWETLATAKERHLDLVTEVELRKSKATLEAEENELLKLEEQIQLHEAAFNDFLSSNYEKVTTTFQRTAAIKAQRKEQEARLEYFSGLLQESQTELQEESERLQEVSAYHQFLQAVTPEQTWADLQTALRRRSARKKTLREGGRQRMGQETSSVNVHHLNHLEEEVRTLRLLDITDSDLYENDSSANSNQLNASENVLTTVFPSPASKKDSVKSTKVTERNGSTKVLRRTRSNLKFRTDSFHRTKSKDKLFTDGGLHGTKKKESSRVVDRTKQSQAKDPVSHRSDGPAVSKETHSTNDGPEKEEKHECLNEHGYDEHLSDPHYLIQLGERYEHQCHTLLTLLTRLEDHIEVTQSELQALAARSKNRADELGRWGHRPRDPLCHQNLKEVQMLKSEWNKLSQQDLTQKKLQQILSLISQIVRDVFGRQEYVGRLLQVETPTPSSESETEVPGGTALLSLLEARFTDMCIQLDAIPPALREQIFQECENDRKMLEKEKQKKQEEEKREQRRKIHLERALSEPPHKQC